MFLKTILLFCKTNSLRRAISELTQGNANFSEALERFISLTKRCPHQRIPSWELIQIFYGGLNDNEKNMVDIANGGTFKETYPNESMQFIENLV